VISDWKSVNDHAFIVQSRIDAIVVKSCRRISGDLGMFLIVEDRLIAFPTRSKHEPHGIGPESFG